MGGRHLGGLPAAQTSVPLGGAGPLLNQAHATCPLTTPCRPHDVPVPVPHPSLLHAAGPLPVRAGGGWVGGSGGAWGWMLCCGLVCLFVCLRVRDDRRARQQQATPARRRAAGPCLCPPSPSPPRSCRASRWRPTPTTKCWVRPTPGWRAACSQTPRPSCAGGGVGVGRVLGALWAHDEAATCAACATDQQLTNHPRTIFTPTPTPTPPCAAHSWPCSTRTAPSTSGAWSRSSARLCGPRGGRSRGAPRRLDRVSARAGCSVCLWLHAVLRACPASRPTRPHRATPLLSATAGPVQRGDALALLLSPEGEFVRGIVTEELAKGIDAGWRLAADAALGSVRQQLLEAAVGGRGGLGGASGASTLVSALAEALEALPRLADERDQAQVEGITRLAQVLQESTVGQRQRPGGDWFQEASAAGGAAAGTPFEAAFASLQTAAAILQWVVVEAEVRKGGWARRGRAGRGCASTRLLQPAPATQRLHSTRPAPPCCRRCRLRSGPRRCACPSALGRRWRAALQPAPSVGWWLGRRCSTPQQPPPPRRPPLRPSAPRVRHGAQPTSRAALLLRRRPAQQPRRSSRSSAPATGEAAAVAAAVAAAAAAAARRPPPRLAAAAAVDLAAAGRAASRRRR